MNQAPNISRIAVLAVAVPLLLAPPLRHLLEASMALHMLVEFPLLLAVGWAAAAQRPRAAGRDSRWDVEGLSSAVLVMLTSALWMLPVALDLALLDPWIALAKALNWLAAGAVLARALQRWPRELRLFVLFNLAWMMATAGLLYRESESRLCVNYLVDQQWWAGTGLLGVALLLGALAIRMAMDEPASAPAGRHNAAA
ncbi:MULTISPECIES: hypothetical protein [unclassified Rhizobacter]|uniref:hypothetical protein n=1 Tax=unclassified Rhizobacter TaxID=2640088 RepID=UPI0006FEA8A7|nr:MULTISPECIES: hypothetical protein [unclassified Rhizobacter]KQU66022.1 hypothetical protein ASC88_10600 [Rhizobacter sp. Root29]KQV97838.1 hypothetical protein ASC98_11050 [Rhizobacter sp. Root1238]KRB18776.1 hypothetical protein ASE08_06000 [Rhizobacter sp. Root16D2]